MPNEKKYFGAENFRLNADDAPFAIGENEVVNLENCRTATTDAGTTATLESIGSTLLISTPAPSITYLTIGNEPDIANNRILKFQYNTTGSEHKIVCLYTDTNIEYDVLRSSQVVGGLNFSKDHPIHSVRILNGLLYWTDDNQEPKKININKALKANNPSLTLNVTPYVLPMVYPTQTIVKRPPYYGLEAVKSVDSVNTNNYINDQAFQMLYFYEYCDFEWSKLSAFSPLLSYGPTVPSSENYITCKLPFSEPIDDDVQKIYICAKFGNTGKILYFRVFDKAIFTDYVQIQSHNAGTTQLTYLFYNNQAGTPLDDIQSTIPFDRAPLKCTALEVARNRLFEGNILVGYDTPVTTSLTAQTVTVGGSGGSWAGVWGYILLSANLSPGGTQNSYYYPFVYVASGAPQKFYYFPAARVASNWNGGVYTPDLISSVNIADATFAATVEATFVTTMKIFVYPSVGSGVTVGTPTWLAGYTASYTYSGVTYPNTVVQFAPSSTANFFKSNGTYNLQVTFYDRFRRKCGVVNKVIQIIIPQRTLSQTVFNTSIQWALSNANALNEIPDWAYFYMVNITKNLTTRFFLQGQTKSGSGGYVVRAQDGTYTYATTLNLQTQYATAFNVTALYANGLGYSFTQGDRITVYLSTGTIANLPIIAQDGNNILFQLTDVGDFTTLVASYEIFTPYISAANEPYYETGLVYPIVNPATANRAYSTITDIIVGDTYNISRTLNAVIFIAETMSPNDRFWRDWETNTGWTNYISTFGQKRLTNQIAFTETYIPDTQINGLSAFDLLNTKTIPLDCGAIQKLILTSKVEGNGTVMLGICTVQTNSLYLQEVRITDSTGVTQFFESSVDVIGTIDTLKGSYGTLNPESVSEYRGNVFFFDVNNGRWIQYSLNGLDDISAYKMQRFWSLWAMQFKSMTAAQIEAFGGRPFVFSAVDLKHKELLISIPKLSNTPPKGYLPDYPSTIYPFDIYDLQAKIIVYKLDMAARLPHWQGSFLFYAENFCTLQNKLYSFKGGLTYLHNQTNSTNEFYGIRYTSRIMCVSNDIPQVPKSYDNTSVQSNLIPSWVYFYNDYPYQQSSELFADMFRDYEGLWYSTIRRNKLSTGVVSYGLNTGEKMRNVAMFIMYEFSPTTTFLELKFIEIVSSISKGHAKWLAK